jgi:hypothetical protein
MQTVALGTTSVLVTRLAYGITTLTGDFSPALALKHALKDAAQPSNMPRLIEAPPRRRHVAAAGPRGRRSGSRRHHSLTTRAEKGVTAMTASGSSHPRRAGGGSNTSSEGVTMAANGAASD